MKKDRERTVAVSPFKAVKRKERCSAGKSEDCAMVVGSASASCSIEGSVTALHHPAERSDSIGSALSTKLVQSGESAVQGNSENRAATTGTRGIDGSAVSGCTIEEPVGTLNQRAYRRETAILADKRVDCGQLAIRRDLECRSAMAIGGCTVKVPTCCSHQAGRATTV